MKIDYIIKKSRRRSMSLSISDDKKILVKAPLGISNSEVEAFIIEKKQWILKQLQKLEQQNQLAQEMGPLSVQDIKQLKKKARQVIPQRVEYYASKTGITYGRISIRLQKSRWGSCSREGNLNFNCLLALMPVEVMDSVIVHELCHRRHMDHSKAFYAEVLSIYPEYKKYDRWLKQNGPAYFKRISSSTQEE